MASFIGTVTQTLWNGATINSGSGTPDSFDGYPFQNSFSSSNQANYNYNPFDTPITWSGTIPNALTNLTVNQLVSLLNQGISGSTNYSIKTDFTFAITSGTQAILNGQRPNINFVIFTTNEADIFATNIAATGDIPTTSSSWSYCSSGCPTPVPFSAPSIIAGFSPYILQSVPWNPGGGLPNQGVSSYTMIAVMTVTLSVTCSSITDLTGTFCLNYCTANNPNLQQCLPNYINVCLTPGSDGTIPLSTNTSCQQFIKQYISSLGPSSAIDTPLDTYCASKYANYTELQRQSLAEQDICACHLSPEFYLNFVESLIAQNNAFRALASVPACLFPQCSGSSYKTVTTRDPCVVPQCIDATTLDIGGTGTIIGPVTVIQNSQCASVDTGGGGTTPPTIKSWWEKYGVWVIVGLGLLVVLIIVILIILASENNKKKPVRQF